MLQTKIKRILERSQLIQRGDTILAACSGGPDSLALVHLLHQLQAVFGFRLAAAHVDHMMRGAQSAAEAVFVDDFCTRLGIVCYQTAVDVPAFIAAAGYSTEEAARVLRYQYLRKVAGQLGGAKIATGHHRDDQAETVLLHLLRGAGSSGLRGMLPESGGIIRPLLQISRQELEAYCVQHQLQPRHDPSNEDTDYLRNHIRLKLLPYLETEYNSNVREALCRTAELTGGEHDFVACYASSIWPQVINISAEQLSIQVEPFARQHIAVQREIIRQVIEKKRNNLKGIIFSHVEKLINMVLNGSVGSVYQLPGGLVAHKRYTTLDIGWQEPERTTAWPAAELAVPGITTIRELGIAIKAQLSETRPVIGAPQTAVFDWQAVRPPITVRARQPGDRFRPLGMQGDKKLKEFFIDEKIPREQRDAIPLICDTQGILWVGGLRQAERGKTTLHTHNFLQLTITKQEDVNSC